MRLSWLLLLVPLSASAQFYTNLCANRGTHGWIAVDADFLDDSRITIEPLSETATGARVNVRTNGGALLIPDVEIFKDATTRDNSRDTLKIEVAKLCSLSNPLQNAILEFEQVPPGLNPSNPERRPGVSRPKRTR